MEGIKVKVFGEDNVILLQATVDNIDDANQLVIDSFNDYDNVVAAEVVGE